jgi:acetolactate synthase-1/2/3 large subunit
VEYPPKLWNPGGHRNVVHLDFLPAEIDDEYHPEVECIGDLAHSLWMLNERVRRDGPGDWDFSAQAHTRARMLEEFAAHADDDTEGSLRPQKVLWDVRRALGPEDVLLSGVGAHKMWVGRYYQCNEPNTCIIPNGFCSMGLALPGAIAASLVRPDRKVLAIAGDGDFLMNVQEMETARRLDADLVVVVWVDGGYGLISWKQESEFGRHTQLSFGNPDWEKLAESFGWHGRYVDRSAELAGALAEALAHPGPSLLALPIDYRENLRLSERLGAIKVPI